MGRPSTAPDARLSAAYALAARVVVRRYDPEVRQVVARLLAGDRVEGVTLDGYLHRLAARRRAARARPRVG